MRQSAPRIFRYSPEIQSESRLEQAVWLMANDVASENAVYTGPSGYVLREYTTHAIRVFIVDELNKLIGMDIQIRVHPVPDAIIGISKTLEEGAWPSGKLVFADQSYMRAGDFEIMFPEFERNNLQNCSHRQSNNRISC